MRRRSKIRRFVAALCIVTGCCALGGVADAAPSKKKKAAAATPTNTVAPEPQQGTDQQHYTAGMDLYEHGSYRDAVIELELASETINKPALQLTLARALDKLERNRDALAHYQAFYAAAPNDPAADEARKRIVVLTPIVARANRSTEDARARPVVTPRAPEPVPVRAPEPVVVVAAPGVDTTPAPTGGFRKAYIGPAAVAGIAVGALGAGIGLLVSAKIKYDGCSSLKTAGTYCDAAYRDSGSTIQASGYAAIGIGAAFAVYDVVLWVLATRHPAEKRALAPASVRGGSLTLEW